MLNKARAGFTLVELMVTIAIAAVILAIVIPTSQGITKSNTKSQCSANLQALGRALLSARSDYQGFPRDSYELDYAFSVVSKRPTGFGGYWNTTNNLFEDATFSPQTDAYNNDGGTPDDRSDDTYFSGVVGLFSLYYLSAYAEGRAAGGGPVDRAWFRGGNYIGRVRFLHCPANPNKTVPEAISAPLLNGYNNYDRFYRRDWFDDAPYPQNPSDERNLVENAFPPGDTLITFCPYHRASQDFIIGRKGDIDLVLFADGVVLSLAAYPYDASNFGSNPSPAEWFSLRRAEREL